MAFTLRLSAALLAAGLTLPAFAHDRDDDCKDGRTLKLVNGRIHTMDKRDRVVSSVVIRNGRFAEIGGSGGGDDECTKTVNLRGRTAVPGIIDNHNHIVLLGLRPGYDTRLEFTSSI